MGLHGFRTTGGDLRPLPSGRIQARYTGPDRLSHAAPVTFETKGDAETWLATVRADIVRGLWRRGSAAPRAFADDASDWLEYRTLKPRTSAHGRSLLTSKILPYLSSVLVEDITPQMICRWYAELGKGAPRPPSPTPTGCSSQSSRPPSPTT